VSFRISIEGVLTPKSRWRQLRSGAGALESTIWLYRTRVGPFALDETRLEGNAAELALCTCITRWRDGLMAGASLKSTNFQREHPGGIYRHYQDRGAPAEGCDDFQSPTQPERYIELRIQPSIHFYSKRIPIYSRSAMVLKMTVLLLGITASVLAHYSLLSWVAISSAAATAIVSWAEFSDSVRKIERYSSTIVDLKGLLSWWKSLNDVQKASKESIETLVRSAEEVISHERTSWMSIAGRKHEVEDEGGERESEVGGGHVIGRSVRITPA